MTVETVPFLSSPLLSSFPAQFVLHLYLHLHLSPPHTFTPSHIRVPMFQTSCLFHTQYPRGREVLGMLAKLQKVTMSFIMSVCPCALDNLAPKGQIFMKYGYLSIFPKSVQTIQVSLKPDTNNRYFT